MKYTVFNNIRFIDFTNTETGEITSISKESITEIYYSLDDPSIFIQQEERDGSHYKFNEVINPSTGDIFVSVTDFGDFILNSANDISAVDLVPLGMWNPVTNTPVLGDNAMYDSDDNGLTDTTAPSNKYFIVSENGTQLIDGNSDWEAGDHIRSTGSVWVRIVKSSLIHSSNVIYEATTVNNTLDDIYSKLNLSELNDTNISSPGDGEFLVFDISSSKWISKEVQTDGVEFVEVLELLDQTSSEPTVDGYYAIVRGTKPVWAPALANNRDILERNGGIWTVYKDMNSINGGSIIISVQESGSNVLYLWGNLEWECLNGFQPNSSYNNTVITNPIGNVSGLTGSALRGKPFNWILENMLFQTIYSPPLLPTFTISQPMGYHFERGSNVSGLCPLTFTQNGGGTVTNFNADAKEGSAVVVANINQPTMPPNINLDNINGYDLYIPGIAESQSWVELSLTYADGPIPEDTDGNQHPGDQILSDTINREITLNSRYPIWYGRTSNRFTVETGEESTTTPFVDPNNGSNIGGDDFNESWIRANLSTELFNSNLNSKVITLQPGDVHAFVVCPPGITVTNVEIFVVGMWVPWNDFENNSFNISINDSEGNNPKSYTVFFVRSVSADNFSSIQDFRFTTSGSVIP